MDLVEIENEIQKLEKSETTWGNCERLSVLYGVKNGMQKEEPQKAMVRKSEFLDAVMLADLDSVFDILDEHMECLRIVYPKEYNAILRKIKNSIV